LKKEGNYLKNLFTDCDIQTFYVCGSDVAFQSSLHLGKFSEEFTEGIIAVARPCEYTALLEAAQPNFHQKFHFATTPTVDISSTIIRNKLIANEPLTDLVCPAVAQYLYQNKITLQNKNF